MNPFEDLLNELGKVLRMKLHVDAKGACSLRIQDKTIQLEPDRDLGSLFIFTRIMETPPGKYREQILAQAMKANTQSSSAIFAYLEKTNELVAFQKYPFSILTGERLASLIATFLEASKASSE